jgi:hypothetical protein
MDREVIIYNVDFNTKYATNTSDLNARDLKTKDSTNTKSEKKAIDKYHHILANMMIKSECAVSKKDMNKYVLKSKIKDFINKLPIDKHPQYKELMSKYAIYDAKTKTYQSCNLKMGPNGWIQNKNGETILYQSPDSRIVYKFDPTGNIVKIIDGIPADNNDYDITKHKDFYKYVPKEKYLQCAKKFASM